MKLPKHYKLKLISALAMYVALLGVVTMSSPDEAPVALIVAPLMLLGVALFLTLKLVFDTVNSSRKTFNTMAASSISAAAVLALMLSALGQVKPVDVVMLLSLVGLAVFYFNRTWPK